MLPTVTRREILEHLLSQRFVALFLLCLILTPASLYIGSKNYQVYLREYNELVRIYEEQARAATGVDIFNGSFSIKAFRPPTPLSIFAIQVEETLPRYFIVTEIGSQPVGSSALGGSILAIFGRIDFLFVIQYIFSLVAIILAYDMISGEKEMGMLSFTLSNPVPRHVLLLGKVTGGCLTLLMPYIVSLLTGLVLVLLFSPDALSLSSLPRIAIILSASFVYLVVFFNLGLLVSTRTRNSKTALLYCFLLWIVLVLVYPKLSGLAAEVVYPVKTETMVNMEKAAARDNLQAEKNRILSRIHMKHYSEDPGAFSRMTGEERMAARRAYDRESVTVHREFDQKINETLRKIDDEHKRHREKQERLAAAISRLSPAGWFTFLVTNAAQLGEVDKRVLFSSVREYESTLRTLVFSKFRRETIVYPDGTTLGSGGFSGRIDASALPRFSFRPAPLRAGAREISFDFIFLVLYAIVLLAAAHVSFLRYDVR